jgi:hypothetical protein
MGNGQGSEVGIGFRLPTALHIRSSSHTRGSRVGKNQVCPASAPEIPGSLPGCGDERVLKKQRRHRQETRPGGISF